MVVCLVAQSTGQSVSESPFTELQESRLMMEQGGQSSTSVSGMSSKRTLEDLFRPPIDLIFKGNLQEVGPDFRLVPENE